MVKLVVSTAGLPVFCLIVYAGKLELIAAQLDNVEKSLRDRNLAGLFLHTGDVTGMDVSLVSWYKGARGGWTQFLDL